jgi:hypothetical protein
MLSFNYNLVLVKECRVLTRTGLTSVAQNESH